MFKTSLLAVGFLGLVCSAAQGADIVEQPLFDWTGPYVGVHAGYGIPSFDGVYDSNEEDREDMSFADDIDADGILGGVQLGYNLQTGSNFVFGIEGDFSVTDFSGDTEDDDPENNDGIDADVDFLASLRARAGFAADNVLFYATGGLAYAHSDFDFTNEGDDAGSIDLDSWGYVVGGGVEWAFQENLSLRIEGLYYGFDTKSEGFGGIDDGDNDDFIELENVGVVRAGINWLF
jgi:outer membrane immunogenic protein